MAYPKYKVNHKYFDVLNPESAYFLGLLAADGNVDKTRTRITLSICERDSEILDNIKSAISSTHPIKKTMSKCRGKQYPQMVFRFSSPYMCKTLEQYGIVPRKSLHLKFPPIDRKIIPSFIRGYFDGDGSVTITKANNIFITILGTRSLLSEMKRHYNEHCQTSVGWVTRHNQSRIFHFCIHGNPCGKSFFKWIYDGSTPHTRLNRKYQKSL